MLYLNAKSATNQLFGVMTSFSSLGNGNTTLGAYRFAKAVLKVSRHPFEMHEELMNVSDYMRGSARKRRRRQGLCKIKKNDQAWQHIIKWLHMGRREDFGFSMMRAVDAATVTPVWFAAYEKGMAEKRRRQTEGH